MSTTAPVDAKATKFLTRIGDRQRQVADSLHVPNPVASGATGIDVLNGADYAIDVDVMEVRSYEHNPRVAANPRFEEIKASITRIGLRSPLCVTRRPGELHYIIEAGGNSRLLALQALYQETANPEFRYVRALYRAWQCESHVLIAHLIENDTRGELLYWDRARALMQLRQQLEAEERLSLSLSDFQAELGRRGYAVSKAALGFYAFAVDRLSALGDRCVLLTSDAVKCLQQGVNRLRRYAEEEHGIGEQAFYEDVVEPVLRRASETLAAARKIDPAELLDQCAGDLAHLACRPAVEVRTAVLGGAVRAVAEAPAVGPARGPVSSSPAIPERWRCPVRFVAPIQAFARAAGIALRTESDANLTGSLLVRADPNDGVSTTAASPPGMSSRALSILLEHCAARPTDEPRTHAAPDADLVEWLLDPGDSASDEFLKTLLALRGVVAETGSGAGVRSECEP